MTKNIVVTGSAGFVGHHVVEYFLNKTDYNIIGIDSFRHKGDSLRLRHLYKHPRFRNYSHDLTTPISNRLIDEIGPVDYILNIASESHVDRSLTDPVEFVRNNIMLALEMAEYARKVKPKMFLQMSTDEVFGSALPGQKHNEWDAHRPSNPYAASKAAQENILFSYWRSYNLPLVRTNTMNIFSLRQDPEKFIPMCISKINKGETVTIHGSPGNIGSRMYLDARNLADAWLFLIKNVEPVLYSDNKEGLQEPMAFNIAGLEEIDNLYLATKIAEYVGKDLNYELVDFHKSRPGHDRAYRLDSSKIYALGWSQPVSTWESLKDVVLWTLDHNNKAWLK